MARRAGQDPAPGGARRPTDRGHGAADAGWPADRRPAGRPRWRADRGRRGRHRRASARSTTTTRATAGCRCCGRSPAWRTAPSAAGPGDVLLVTGGGKGITAECALALARDTGAAVGLLGRSDPAADAELAANLARMAAAGVTLPLRAGRRHLGGRGQAAVEEIRAALGPVTAVLHGAGRNEPARSRRPRRGRLPADAGAQDPGPGGGAGRRRSGRRSSCWSRSAASSAAPGCAARPTTRPPTTGSPT